MKLDAAAPNAAVLDSVEDLLDRQNKPVTERNDDHIAFDDPLWRGSMGPNWLAMIMYDRGRVWIERGIEEKRLRYDLRSLHCLIFCLTVFPLFFAVAAFGGADTSDILKAMCFAVFAFCWIYGGNLALALLRVPRAMRKAATFSISAHISA